MPAGDAEYSDAPGPVQQASWGVKLAVLAGMPISAYALCWLDLVPIRHYYNWRDELGVFFAMLCVEATFTLCWGGLSAYVIRRFSWSPRACNLCVMPFLPVYLVIVVLGARPYMALASAGVVSGLIANRLCWKFAYPTIDRRTLYRNFRGGPNLRQR